MKKVIVFTGIALFTANVWALDDAFGDKPELDQSIMKDHSMGEKFHSMQMGEGEMYGSMLIPQPADHIDPVDPYDPQAKNENVGDM